MSEISNGSVAMADGFSAVSAEELDQVEGGLIWFVIGYGAGFLAATVASRC